MASDKVRYIGPTDRNKGLFWGTLYQAGQYPANIAALLKEIPGLAAQFVPEKEFAKRRPPGARIRRTVKPPLPSLAQPPIRRK